MKRLTVLAMIALAALGTAKAQDPDVSSIFRAQLDRLAAQAQAQMATTDAAIYKALHMPAVAPQKAVVEPVRHLDPMEAEALRAALERGARCLTGKLVKDTASPLWVPEMKPNCN